MMYETADKSSGGLSARAMRGSSCLLFQCFMTLDGDIFEWRQDRLVILSTCLFWPSLDPEDSTCRNSAISATE